MSEIFEHNFKELENLNIPAKRAAYSDRTAWLMAILSEIAYTRFDEESEDTILDIAKSLVEITSEQNEPIEAIKTKLVEFSQKLATTGHEDISGNNTILKDLLKLGGFELAGGAPIHDKSTDTQAFIAVRRNKEGTGFAVICFRGTQQIRDWLTNLKISTVPIYDPKGLVGECGQMHEGFHNAYKSVESTIKNRLNGFEDLPLYITGHSLGGALAVVATWYQSSQRLAACYTFGAPRVGDSRLIGRFKTPIYRIVNGADPVPFVPQAESLVNVLKFVLRVFSFLSFTGKLLTMVINLQGFMHYGDMKYLPMIKSKDGEYPGLRLHPHVSTLHRMKRYITAFFTKKFDIKLDDTSGQTQPNSAKPDRIDKYHQISRYRDKLRVIAKNRNA